jgi:hypothetical protein
VTRYPEMNGVVTMSMSVGGANGSPEVGYEARADMSSAGRGEIMTFAG